MKKQKRNFLICTLLSIVSLCCTIFAIPRSSTTAYASTWCMYTEDGWYGDLPDGNYNKGDAVGFSAEGETIVLNIYVNDSLGHSCCNDNWSYTFKNKGSISSSDNNVYITDETQTYTIQYEVNGGSMPSGWNTSYSDQEALPSPLPEPTKTGYTFAGWFTTKTFKQSATAGSTISANTTLYAKWTAITYNITYNLDSGTNSGSNPDTYNIETSDITLANPTREGYGFCGWWAGAGGTGTQYTTIAEGSTGDLTLYAYWKPIPTFNTSNQSIEYTALKQGFEIKDYSSGATYPTIQYALHADSHLDSDWGERPRSVGVYDIRVTASAVHTDYATLDTVLSSAFEITPKEVTLTWVTTALSYTGESIAPAVTVGGLCGTDTCTATIEGHESAIGTGYTATVTALSNSNYKLPDDVSTTFSIKYDIQIDVTPQVFNIEDDDIAFAITGTNIPTDTSGFTIKYGIDYDALTTDITSWISNYYWVCITYGGDDTHNPVSEEIQNGLQIYYTVTYNMGTATSGEVPVDSTDHIGSTVIYSKANTGNLAREGYVFTGWLYCYANPTTSDDVDFTKVGNAIVPNINSLATTGNIQVYPCWQIVLEDLTKTNNFTVTPTTGASLTGCTYQWYEDGLHMNELPVGDEGYTLESAWMEDIYAVAISLASKYIPKYEDLYVYIKASGNVQSGYEDITSDGYYKCLYDDYVALMGDDVFTITDFYFLGQKAVDGETSTTITNLVSGQLAYCIVKCPNTIGSVTYYTETTTNKIGVYSIAFDGNGATSGSVDTLYQLEGRQVTLPTNGFSKTNYKFTNWTNNSTNYNAGTLYTVGASNITFSAGWQAKNTVNVTETTKTVTYNGKAQAFTVTSVTNVTVEYNSVGDTWTTTAPTDAGTYNVRLTRDETDNEASYSNVINGGLVIEKYTISTVTTNESSTFTYNGKDQTSSMTATYVNIGGTNVSLVVVSSVYCNTNAHKNVAFKNAGYYLVAFSFVTDEELQNYKFVNVDPEFEEEDEMYIAYYEMYEKEVEIVWETKTYTYTGSELTKPTAKYVDIAGNDVALTVTLDKTLQNAGDYTATVSFATTDYNYVLPTTVTKTYTIGKAKVTKPTADTTTFVYTGLEQKYTLTTSTLYTITNDTMTNAGSQTVSVVLSDKDNYVWADDTATDLTFTFTIGKATPTYTAPTGLTATYGDTLANVTLPSGFTWKDATTTSVGNAGANTFCVTYTPADTDNYKVVNDIEVSVSVGAKLVAITWCNKVYVANNAIQVITATYQDINGNTVALAVSTDRDFKDAGTYTATASFANNETNYLLPTDVTKSYTIVENVVLDNKEITEEEKKPAEGSKVDLIAGSLDVNIVVVIEKDDSEQAQTIAQNVKSAVNSKSEIVAKFDIHLEDDNGIKVENIEGNHYKVTLAIPTEIQGKEGYAIVYIKDDGTVERYNATVNDTLIVFETDHFSTWAIVADEVVEEGASIVAIILIVLVALILIFVGLFFVWKYEYDKVDGTKSKDKSDRKLKFLDPVYLPINNLIFAKKNKANK